MLGSFFGLGLSLVVSTHQVYQKKRDHHMLGNFYGVKAPASSSVSIPPIRSYQIPHHIFSVDLGVAPSHVLLVMIFPGKLLKSVYVHQPGCIFVPETPYENFLGKFIGNHHRPGWEDLLSPEQPSDTIFLRSYQILPDLPIFVAGSWKTHHLYLHPSTWQNTIKAVPHKHKNIYYINIS